MERKEKHRYLLCLLLLLTVFLTACGNKKDENSYIYVAELLSASNAGDFKVADE